MTFTKTLAATFAALSLTVGAAVAQDFPTKPIELVVPYGAGGLTDAFARGVAQAAEEELGQKIVVVNRPGGGATIGLTSVFAAEPDGYTVAFTTSSPLVIQPLYGKTAYKTTDFQPILRLYDIPVAINVQRDSELQGYEDWLEWVKANPGEFTYGTSGGTGSGGHIATEQLGKVLDVDIRHIPFEGSAALAAAVMGGQIKGSNQLPNIHRDGEIRPLFFMSPSRPTDAVYDSVPTVAELGIDAEVVFFSGIIAHKDVPADRISILNDAFRAAMDAPNVQELFERDQIMPDPAGPEAFAEIIAAASKSNETTMREIGLIE
ncbi:tripartite tricarboxylate transporter substrate binding protein [Marivita sp. S6314]|uniref:Bug family tripartite tricarboxylate transporter substrate binding protein n=1 Tax=Marivita sp. S6314 TaxID=2926406 RepID=UPI001FF137D1|nr:tripartite tricarboxylate transporter substrate binding protein [Marivita sp. S6314]MCK0150869.1 tripartite tricarboxylate transporter substrate binding protein [Marivita sp. S6314]